ncbi:MAG: BLUF domain-containing protein [Pedobacter sp.]
MLYYTVYISDASSALSQEKNDILMEELKRGDIGKELSGMIACIKGISVRGLKGMCIQVFEGPKYAVREAITLIELDNSRQSEWIYTGETEKRDFKGLNTAFEYLNLDTCPEFVSIFDLNVSALKTDPCKGAKLLIDFAKQFLRDSKDKY